MKTNLCLASSFQAHKNYDFIVYDFLSTQQVGTREENLASLRLLLYDRTNAMLQPHLSLVILNYSTGGNVVGLGTARDRSSRSACRWTLLTHLIRR